jgi:hypothetical protein
MDAQAATATLVDGPEAARNAAAYSPVAACATATRAAPRNNQPIGCSGRRLATSTPTVAKASPLIVASRQ